MSIVPLRKRRGITPREQAALSWVLDTIRARGIPVEMEEVEAEGDDWVVGFIYDEAQNAGKVVARINGVYHLFARYGTCMSKSADIQKLVRKWVIGDRIDERVQAG